MEIIIRPAELDDAESLQRIRVMSGVREAMLTLGTERISDIREDLVSAGRFMHTFVAIDASNQQVLGFVSMTLSKSPRQRHKARISIAVDKKFQNQGIGSRLLSEILDIADNWMKLVKVDLTVLISNTRAIKLYEQFGFQQEGTLKYDCIYNGAYADVALMARYNLPQ